MRNAPNMMSPQQIVYGILQTRPDIANSPQGQQLMQILQSGDNEAGMQMAMNICNSYGVTPQQALSSAINFFKNPR